MTGTDSLTAALRELAADQPPQPDRVTSVMRAHRRERHRLGASMFVAAVGLSVGAAALTQQFDGSVGADLVTPAAPAGWDSRYVPWQAIDDNLEHDEVAQAVQAAWSSWSGTAGAPDGSVKAIAVAAGGVGPGAVVFQAANEAGALRLVSAAWSGSTAVVIDDVPAPDPSTVPALVVVAQSEDGLLRDLSEPTVRATASDQTATTLTMFVPPTTADPRIRFTADAATTADGITTGEFGKDGVLGYGLGPAGRGPVPAQSVHVTIHDGQRLLYEGGPWLTR